ncbi:D-alanyl-D-alanine carboxypeptidase family protein [Streptomyces beijiangensis]|uniref:D-alanyl-D-alanine carboxypeptidase n=1 Tax=Streptomyces beijiangensis TaxID=163361 RepID=A0A939JFF5_9ACTN|nr:serine hydrolase [Streptomyces beijiangensis]MBO0514081.1 D-alanyl-D-alanine carboxypeptidase [Streptomyces beijiangensis]
MAGESPDKSEQRKSSGESDPRLAVFRERPSGGDQPTQVFRAPVPDVPDVPESAAPAPDNARLRAAVAAWVATADDPADETEPERDAEAEPETEPETASASEEAPEPSDAEPSDAEPSDAEPADETPAAADDADAEPEPEPEDPAPSDDDTPEEAAEVEEADPEPEKAPAEEATPAKAEPSDAADDAAEAEAEPEPDANDDPEPEPEPDDKTDESAKRPVAEAKGVDQHTAVFRLPKATAVDQPTTALKISDVPPRKPVPGKPEGDAERTSTFVPLKASDVRTEPKKPEPLRSGPPTPAAPVSPLPDVAERTKQQPLPPRPPLDLLAELTNTPPPARTHVRTIARRFKIWTPLILLLVIVFAVVQAVRPLPTPALALSTDATYTFAGGKLSMPWPAEGQSAAEVVGVGSLGTSGAQKSAPTASMAKVMTAYVILKDHPLTGKATGPTITVDKAAGAESSSADESTAQIKEGQTYTEKQMLQLLLIPSGNNVARLLSRWDGGTAAFLKKMNDAAAALGMTNTTYTDPSGFDSKTVSTATDQVKLGKVVMDNEVFQEIVNTPQIEIPGVPGTIYNNNSILLKPGVSGIKTGSSTPAGGNLLWAANTVIDGKERRIVGAVMGQQKGTTLQNKLDTAITNSYTLIQKAQQDVTSATVIKKGAVVGYVDDGLGGKTPVVATKDLKAVGWPGLQVDIKIGDGGKAVPHSGKAGTVVGQVSVGSGPGMVTSPVALQSDLSEPGFGEKLTRVS